MRPTRSSRIQVFSCAAVLLALVSTVSPHASAFAQASHTLEPGATTGNHKEHTTEFFGGIAAGRTEQFTSPHVSAFGGLGVRFASGVSLEFEAAHTLEGVLHPNTCVVESRTCCPCVIGVPFKEGLESLGTATVQIRYTYTGWRVQPFIGGGFGMMSISTNSIINEHYRATSALLPLGAGVRVPITRSFAIRPELSYYVRAWKPDVIRASIGMIYKWK